MSGAAGSPCTPQGELSPWVDDRPRTCTVCAEFVSMRALPDGSDWIAVDVTGAACATEPTPELCACYPADDSLRTRDGTIIKVNRGPDVEIDEKSKHYGAGLWIADPMRSLFHTHNALGGEVYRTEFPQVPLACGHRLPPTRRTAMIEALVTDQEAPECHGWPMRWAPRGWQCRMRGLYFPPTG